VASRTKQRWAALAGMIVFWGVHASYASMIVPWGLAGALATKKSAEDSAPKVLTLDECVKRAFNNPLVKQQYELLAAINNNKAPEVYALYDPDLSLLVRVNFPLNVNVNEYGTNDEVGRIGLSSTVTAYDFGLKQSLVKQADADSDQFAKGLEYQRQNLLIEVIGAYFATASAQTAIDVDQQAVDANQSLVNVTQGRLDAGVVTKVDLEAAKAMLSGAIGTLGVAKSTLAIAQSNLARLIGSNPAEDAPVVALPAVSEFDTTNPNIVETAISRDPEVSQLTLQVRLAEDRLDITDVEERGKFDVTAGVGLQAAARNSSGTFTDGVLYQPYGHLRLAYTKPLIEGRSLKFQRQDLQNQVDLAKVTLLAYEQTLRQSVFAIVQNQEGTLAQITNLSEAVAAAKEAQSLAEARYADGLAIQQEVLNADFMLSNLTQQLESAKIIAAANVVKLRVLTGVGAKLPPVKGLDMIHR